MPSYFFLIVGVLGVWRITHLLSEEAGPGQVFSSLRRTAGTGFWGQLFGCFYCMSVWVALPFALFLAGSWKERTLLWPALSGAAILLQRISSAQQPASRGFFLEDTFSEEKEDEHVLR